MAILSIAEALRRTLREEMARDFRVILIGEDVRHGVMGVTEGLVAEFGPARVLDMPISESAFLGAATGAAATGLRPVVELMFADFSGVAFDVFLNQMSKWRYMSGGQVSLPLVIRTTIGAGERAAAQHSQSLHHLFTAIPGLKCALPATPADAAGLLRAAIRDPDPVILFEHKMLYAETGEVPDGVIVPFGRARRVRKGRDLTIVAFSRMVVFAEAAAELLVGEGIETEILDPRTSVPLDEEAILDSLARTGRLLVADEGAARCGLAADIAALAASRGFSCLRAPIALVTPPHCPVPFAAELEDAWLPDATRIADAARRLVAA